MSREIKFRAWSKNRDCHFMAIQGTPDLETLQSFMFHYGDEKLLMQFTGLTDENGVEIYEGDIVKKTIELEAGLVHNYEVIFGEAGFDIKRVDSTGKIHKIYLKKYCKHSYEVIGNIHETPELLINNN